ncbi:hypothetical protein NPIL_671911 [Nephila pilipes]|uniref:Uncharacterized protein n=1 Tax=Nephila pilipes TaxID=299642 RepID=A0A8X6NS43_NEPPI|nr:hypothetical protein NPIL_671911 [Nephila pilipes]
MEQKESRRLIHFQPIPALIAPHLVRPQEYAKCIKTLGPRCSERQWRNADVGKNEWRQNSFCKILHLAHTFICVFIHRGHYFTTFRNEYN